MRKMPGKKSELQTPLQEILEHKEGNHGKQFKIQIAHYPPKWVPERVKTLTRGGQVPFNGITTTKKVMGVDASEI